MKSNLLLQRVSIFQLAKKLWNVKNNSGGSISPSFQINFTVAGKVNKKFPQVKMPGKFIFVLSLNSIVSDSNISEGFLNFCCCCLKDQHKCKCSNLQWQNQVSDSFLFSVSLNFSFGHCRQRTFFLLKCGSPRHGPVGLGYRGDAGAQLSFALSNPSHPREKFIPHRPLLKKVSLLFQAPEIDLC